MKKSNINSDNINKIVLIGYRCVGKTSIGRELSRLIDWNYISTDQLIEENAEMSINQIVEKGGWKTFRKIEHEVIQGLSNIYSSIIDCGGGVVENKKNMILLKTDSMVIWIDAAKEIILQRLSLTSDRPPLMFDNVIKDIEFTYQKRLPLYKTYCDYYLENSSGIIEEKAREILQLLTEKGIGC